MEKKWISVNIQGRNEQALGDSGADYSVISEAIRRSMRAPVFKENGPLLRAADKKPILTLGKCSLEVQIKGLDIIFDFVVAAECSHDVILGWGFFRATDVIIDCGKNKLYLSEAEKSYEWKDLKLCAALDCVIPPKSFGKIVVTNQDVFGSRDVVVTGSKHLQLEKGLFIPSYLVRFLHGRAVLWVTNSTHQSQVIPSDMKVGTMQDLEVGSISNLDACSEIAGKDEVTSPDVRECLISMISTDLEETKKNRLLTCLNEFADIFDFEKKSFPSEVEKMMETKIIRPSSSPWASPVILVRKKDGSLRFCVDYRRLNKITKKDVYPLPRIDDALDTLSGSRYFPTMDMRSGYWQIEVDDKDREKTAFITSDGLYEFNCHFASRQITILGHVVNEFGTQPDPEKVKAIVHFPKPRNISETGSFLGLSSYYRRFIKSYANKSRPLNSLLKNDEKFIWGEEQDESFRILKQELGSSPVLGHFIEGAETHVHTDASGYGLGAVLVQIQNDAERPIAYASRTLTKAEMNYSTTEKECLAVVRALGKFRPYLYGRPFTVVTDHHSLCWLVGLKDPSGRSARWALKLQEYDINIVYKSGRKHKDADCLSRSPLADTAEIEGHITSIQDIAEEQKNYDPEGKPCLLVVPKHMRHEILKDVHDTPMAGHLGFAKTYDRVRKRFYWPGLYGTVSQYIAHCKEYQRRKGVPQKPPGLLVPIPPTTSPFQKIGIDYLGRFPISHTGNRWIIVATDYLTRFAITKAAATAEATELATFLIEDVILKHGAPREIITDRGRNFMSQTIREINNLNGTIHRFTTAYHPQTNGLTERLNKTLTDMISMYVDVDQKNWDNILPYVTFAYNTARQETTGYSPFFLVHSREVETPLDSILPYQPAGTAEDYVGHLVTNAEDARMLACLNILQAQSKDKERYDKKHKEVTYKEGDLVWVFTPVRTVGLSEKLLKRYFGPYQKNIEYIVHVVRMKPYHDPEVQEQIAQGVVATQTTKPDDDSLLPGREDRAIGRGTGEREGTIVPGSTLGQRGAKPRALPPFRIKRPPRLRLSDKKPVCVRPYRHSLRDRDLIKQQIEQLLKITYLGYEISENQISPSGVNVDVIKSLPPPRDLRCLRSFLGSVTHYAKFIKNFSNLRAPSNELLKKNSRFIWTEECQRSFEDLKEALCSKPILQLFNPFLATHIYCDASISGIGAVLKQEYPDGTQKPFTYFSRALRGAESKYTITELELLADRIVVPLELQDNLIQKAHESLGHQGISAMIRALSVQYYFKGMIGKIKNYVKNCKECQTIKSSTQPSYGLMESLPRAAKPFDVVALDTVWGLGGYNSAKNCIHTVIDHHSRYIWGYAFKGTSIATYINIINQLLNIGKPRILVTDRHPSFVSKRFNKFLQEKGIKHVMTSPSHPECNGLLERANATLIGRLKIQHQGNPRAPWPKLLQKTLEEYRNTPHSKTTFPPIYLLYGTLPSYISDLTNPYPPVEKARTIANEKNRGITEKVGHGKLSPVYYPDPYTVLSTPSPHIVEINKPCQPENKPSTIVNVSKLKLWDPISTSNEGMGNYPFPFQDVEDLNGCL
ncbi:hypothetical protein LAZ67_5003095 [Cordylochernes scorpioides]|uniref:RNA-directed DNA polymerase n=1 Tax=Cordylochernes scorpioides TaxID=51811 RepID=A0ABY6KIT3_9ARAC|nr:hypothetical protein LAZ67_5003095 [Cordylochernes scorpioides]